jgi:uncharacterized membrane protein YbhN (UPF0104 family)
MRPTRPSILVLAALVAGAISYGLTRSSYDTNPRPTAAALFGLALLAIAECYVAVMTRARLAGRSGTRPIDPLVVARFVALAKASSIVGALATGGYAGFVVWVGRIDSPAANSDTTVASIGIALSIALTAAALFLEYVCRVPKDDEDDRREDQVEPRDGSGR